ncbi:MAG: hypothetical protein ACPL06_02160 [Candidatus Anstonellales archaeon]
MVVRKIYSVRDLKDIDHYGKFSHETRTKIKNAIAYIELVEERYKFLSEEGMLKGTMDAQIKEIRVLIKSDLEAHAKKAERTAEFEKDEERKLRIIADTLLIISGLMFLATNFNPAVGLAGVLLSGIVYLEALLCRGRALAKRDEAQFLREYDIEAGL